MTMKIDDESAKNLMVVLRIKGFCNHGESGQFLWPRVLKSSIFFSFLVHGLICMKLIFRLLVLQTFEKFAYLTSVT